jgi:hypothetical protein
MIEETLRRFSGDKSKAARDIGWTGAVAEKTQPWASQEAIRWGREVLSL